MLREYREEAGRTAGTMLYVVMPVVYWCACNVFTATAILLQLKTLLFPKYYKNKGHGTHALIAVFDRICVGAGNHLVG